MDGWIIMDGWMQCSMCVSYLPFIFFYTTLSRAFFTVTFVTYEYTTFEETRWPRSSHYFRIGFVGLAFRSLDDHHTSSQITTPFLLSFFFPSLHVFVESSIITISSTSRGQLKPPQQSEEESDR